MRRLALALVLLCLAVSADAFQPRGGGGGGVPSCPNGISLSPAGSTISPDNTNCILKDSAGKTWQFQSGGVANSAGNYPLLINGVVNVGYTQAEIGADGVVYVSFYNGNCTKATSYNFISPPPTPEILADSAAYGTGVQPTFATGVPGAALGYYRVTHSGVTTNYNTAGASISAALAGDTIHWLANPPGLDKWQQITTPITAAGATINLDAGYTEGCESAANPGFLQVNAANVTINGSGNGTFRNGATLTYGSNIIVQPNASNLTINGMHLTYGFQNTTFLSSNLNEGVITIENSTIEKVQSDGAGQEHLTYLGDDVVGSTTASALIQNNYYMDILGGGWDLKLRPLGINTQGHVTQNTIGCSNTLANTSAWVGCQQNGVIDLPCGGDWLIDYNSLEYGPHAANWYIIRALEESFGPACPTRVDILGDWVNGTTINNAFGLDPNGVSGDPRAHGAIVGDTFASTSGGCPGGGVTCSTTIASFSGTSPNMTITVTCNETPNCLTNPNQSNFRYAKQGPTHITADETGCATTSTLCNLKDANGNALTPANAYIFNTYLVSAGTGVPAGAVVASQTSTSITLTCASPPCTDGSSTGVVVSFIPPLGITIDHNVLVWDAPGTGAAYPMMIATTGCTMQFPQATCSLPAGGKVTFTNNDIVGTQHDSKCDPGNVTGLGVISPGTTDANGNTCYASRLAYATAKGLLNTTDFAGNTCTTANACAAPFTFPHM